MQIIVSIDDTDNIDSRGTGQLAAQLAKETEKWGRSFFVTRHQLLVHADIPYTSHNSCMCFAADVDPSSLDELVDYASRFLRRESAAGSDPGLCIAVPDRLARPELLIEFGLKAKRIILVKQDAYDLASRLGIHLSEHGGTGQGVIGALAGAGLRLSGNDGRSQGQLKVSAETGIISVGDLCARGKVDLVKSRDGAILGEDELIKLGDFLKTVLRDGRFVFLVEPAEGDTVDGVRWQSCAKQYLKKF